MDDRDKTKPQLINELAELRQQVRELERSEVKLNRAEETLDSERRQLLSVFDHIDELIYVTDPETYEILYANPPLNKAFNKQLVGEICYRVFQGMDSPCQFCTNEIILKNRDIPYRWEYYDSLLDRHFAITDRIIRWPDGRDVRFEITKDITEYNRIEESLRESEKTLKSILRAGPIGIGLVCNRMIKQVNDSFCEMLGYSREELLDQSARLVHPTDQDFEYVGHEKYNQIRESGTGTVETRLQRKDGRVIEVLLSSALLDTEDLSMGVTFSVLDITERKRAEEVLRESEEKYKTLAESSLTGPPSFFRLESTFRGSSCFSAF